MFICCLTIQQKYYFFKFFVDGSFTLFLHYLFCTALCIFAFGLKCIPKFYVQGCAFFSLPCFYIILFWNALCILNFVFNFIPKFYVSRVYVFSFTLFLRYSFLLRVMYSQFCFQIYSQILCVKGVHFLSVEVQSSDCYHIWVIMFSIFWSEMACGFLYFQYFGVKCYVVSRIFNILELNAMRVLVISFPRV